MLIVGESYAKLRNELAYILGRVGNVTEAGEEISTRIFWTVLDVTVRANDRRWSFPSKELLAMTAQTRSMFGKIADIGKRIIALTYFFPVL